MTRGFPRPLEGTTDRAPRASVHFDAQEIRVHDEQGRIEAALLKCIGADARNCGSGGALLRLEVDWIEVELR